MKIRRFLPASVLMLAAWASGAGVARADTLLYDGISVISGAQSSVQSFNVTAPGTLTVTLSAAERDTLDALAHCLDTSRSDTVAHLLERHLVASHPADAASKPRPTPTLGSLE